MSALPATSSPLASDPVAQALCPLALQMRRGSGLLVGRPTEMAAIDQELRSARTRLTCLTLEGEPGIGKTRLLLAATQLATEYGFTTIAVSADEELRGPFLLIRSILASLPATEAASRTAAEEPLHKALLALSGHGDPTLETMPADQKLLRQFDLAALSLRALASVGPLALFVDDLQWADEDSLRALRYVLRTVADAPLFLLLALRPEETAVVTEAVTLIADMERMGMVRRLHLARFTQIDTASFMRQLLGGKVSPTGAATVHAQAEGVPFITEELIRAYRDTGMIQEIDGMWTLARNAERLLPSAVQTLIQRRSGRLPEETKTVLAEAAVLGRSFSLRDLGAVKQRLGHDRTGADDLAATLTPAVSAGLLALHQADAPADYSFTHEQVREFARAVLTPPLRRAIHSAIVEMLLENGEPTVQSLPLLVHHAAAAGETERCARFSTESARAGLAANAPEEVLRVIDIALPLASAPRDRVTMLALRDDALDMLRRPADRLEGLAELAALADALGDDHLELEVILRRAAALRLSTEEEQAAELARRVRRLAVERDDRASELAACLELGQDIVGSALGESFVPAAAEIDLDAAEEAFGRAAALAEELGEDAALDAARRELGTIEIGRVRGWFVERVKAGEQWPILARAVAGETLDEIIPTLPVAPHGEAAHRYLDRALNLFEKIGDRRGVMSSVIAMAYLRYGAEIHMGTNPAERIEEIHRLATRMKSLTRESERAAAEAQMLFGVHVFARAKVIPDLALSRGEDTYHAAVALGDRSLQFLSAGGVAMSLLDLGDVDGANRWLDLAAQAAAASPTPLRARRLEIWRGMARAAILDAKGMLEHFERALRSAEDQSLPAARCEILALIALESASIGAALEDEELLANAERAAGEAKALLPLFPAHPPWGAQADAALAEVALARGDLDAAATAGRSATGWLQTAMREDAFPEILLPVAKALLAAGTEEEKEMALGTLRLLLAMTAQRTLDESVRVRWFKGPVGREWARLAGPVEAGRLPADGDGQVALAALDEEQSGLLALLTEGLTNRQIGERMGLGDEAVALKLREMFATIGASSRGDATAFALREGVL